MSHVRQQIRDAFVAALTPLGPVHASRVYPVQPDELPVRLVYTGSEEFATSMSGCERRLQVIVEIIASGANFDDTLDAELVDVEKALLGNLSSPAGTVLPVSIEVSASADGSAPIGRAQFTFEVLYRTAFADPETSI